MQKEPLRSRVIGALGRYGLKLLGKTIRIEIKNLDCVVPGSLAGYWHGDGLATMMLAGKIAGLGIPMAAVVTADWRGDVIERAIGEYGVESLRISDGYAARRSLGMLREVAAKRDRVIAISLDGPTGPLYEPKRLAFKMAKDTGCGMLFISCEYSKALRINRRWDKYAVPLPFSRVSVRISRVGEPVFELAKTAAMQ